MKDEELIKLFDKSYKEQYDDLFQSLDKIYINAVDKHYAIYRDARASFFANPK